MLRKKERAAADNNTLQIAVTSKSLGDWYHEHQKYQQALDCYIDEAKAYEQLGINKLEIAKANRMIGEMFMLLENFDDALKHELIYLSK